MIDFLEQMSNLPSQINLAEAKPTGPVGMMFKMMNKDCRQGLGVAVEMTRALGKIKEGEAEKGGQLSAIRCRPPLAYNDRL